MQFGNQVVNSVNEDTAHVLAPFPYAFGINTAARYWVETKPAYGQRAMLQLRNPATGEWFRAKTDGYFDVAVLEVKLPDGNPMSGASLNAGHVVIHNIDFSREHFTVETIKQFAEYFILTPFQKEQVMKALAKKNHYYSPNWKDSSVIDYELNRRAETKMTALEKAESRRKRDANGFALEGNNDVLKRERRERAEELGSYRTPKPVHADADDTTGMTPEQIAIYNDLMGKS